MLCCAPVEIIGPGVSGTFASGIVAPVTFAVLFVCTGNICRSPVAERLMRARLGPHAPVSVSSAGTAGLAGHRMDRASAVALRELGGDPDGHVARRLDARLVRAAELILTMETMHRSVVVQADPLAMRRAFTLREFGRLGAGLGPPAGQPAGAPPGEEDLRERVAQIAGQRGLVEPVDPAADEIGDPFGAPIEVARQQAAEVSEAVDAALAALGLVPIRAKIHP
jgi:protein-tyrosine phosphatase